MYVLVITCDRNLSVSVLAAFLLGTQVGLRAQSRAFSRQTSMIMEILQYFSLNDKSVNSQPSLDLY